MHPSIAIIIISLALIVFVCHYLNNKVVDHQESCKLQNKFVEQATIDDTTDAPAAIDVVDVPDSLIKKVIKHEEAPVKKTRAKKTTRKSQNDAKLRNK